MVKITQQLISFWMLTTLSLFGNAATDTPQPPGTGISVTPVFSTLPEEHFRGEIAIAGLQELGYEVLPAKQSGYATMLLALAYGDADFSIHMWNVLHDEFYQKAGGVKAILKTGNIVPGLKQGYLIDRKTAEKHGINSLNDLADPTIAALFDTDEDGKADLTGCNPDWGCKDIIDEHLKTYGLNSTVSHNRGDYFALMKATIKRYKSGKPVLYYTWLPQWISSVLVPGKDVIWLSVEPPETLEGVVLPASLPAETTSEDQAAPAPQMPLQLGFEDDQIKAVMNQDFAAANPAARTFLSLLQIPAADESAQNLKMMRGEKSPEDIKRHAKNWIKKNRKVFDGWLEKAIESVPVTATAEKPAENTAPANTSADDAENTEKAPETDDKPDDQANSAATIPAPASTASAAVAAQ